MKLYTNIPVAKTPELEELLAKSNRAQAKRVYAVIAERYKRLFPESQSKSLQKFMVY